MHLSRQAQSTHQQHRLIDQRLRLQRHVDAAAKADARRRGYGNLVVTAFVVLAVVLAGYTLHAEQRQQQQLQQLR